MFPGHRLIWAGRTEYALWTDPLGLERASPDLQRGILRLHGGSHWPRELEGAMVLWFGLRTCPVATRPGVWFLPGLPSGWDVPPREAYLEQLRRGLGIGRCTDWLGSWRNLFCSPQDAAQPQTALLFPGSGHRAKCWPEQRFAELAFRLQHRGLPVRFVLGPAEQERGVRVQEFEHVHCRTLPDLQRHLNRAGLVVGNDCGPLHLAGMLGRPALALFGPTPASQWGPVGARIVESGAECAPCTNIADITCTARTCMEEIGVDTVARECFTLLAMRPGAT